jgi:hypothetical protein
MWEKLTGFKRNRTFPLSFKKLLRSKSINTIMDLLIRCETTYKNPWCVEAKQSISKLKIFNGNILTSDKVYLNYAL